MLVEKSGTNAHEISGGVVQRHFWMCQLRLSVRGIISFVQLKCSFIPVQIAVFLVSILRYACTAGFY